MASPAADRGRGAPYRHQGNPGTGPGWRTWSWRISKPPISSTPWCNPAPAGARNPLTTRRHSTWAYALLPGHVGPPGPGGQPPGKACPPERPSPSTQAGTRVFGESGNGAVRRASAILARAQRRDVRPNIWASRRSGSGLPACTLSRLLSGEEDAYRVGPSRRLSCRRGTSTRRLGRRRHRADDRLGVAVTCSGGQRMAASASARCRVLGDRPSGLRGSSPGARLQHQLPLPGRGGQAAAWRDR